MPFPCRISTCKWLCSRFRGGRRKSNLPWSGVKRGWGHSWCCKEDRAWWSEVVVSPKMEKKRGKVWPADEKKKSGEKMFFCQLCTLIFSHSGYKIHLYLYGMKEGNLVFVGKKFRPLIWLERISTVGSKYTPWTVIFDSSRLPELVTLDRRHGCCSVNRPAQTIPNVAKCQVIILVQVLSNLVENRGIECTCKIAHE